MAKTSSSLGIPKSNRVKMSMPGQDCCTFIQVNPKWLHLLWFYRFSKGDKLWFSFPPNHALSEKGFILKGMNLLFRTIFFPYREDPYWHEMLKMFLSYLPCKCIHSPFTLMQADVKREIFLHCDWCANRYNSAGRTSLNRFSCGLVYFFPARMQSKW